MINIAIDGPAGAGKSTIAKNVAKNLGYIYVDTGALYRTVGLYVLRKKFDTKNAETVTSLLKEMKVELKFINGTQRVYLNGEDVSEEIRTPEASMAASNVSAISSVRNFLFALQQDIAQNNNCIMDGRDIGTVVLPNAQVKIFLTASVEERAKRRYLELVDKGMKVVFEDVIEEMKQRDYQDSHRKIAPLRPAQDAVILDTTNESLQQVLSDIEIIVEEKTHG
ncbi:MAG: (d)CMP kinase [Oscillospiraceae bacterium]